MNNRTQQIVNGQTIIGIELGSTRIKALLIDSANEPIAQGGHTWENQLVDGVWTYSLEAVEEGLQAAFASLKEDVQKHYGVELTKARSLGISAMMHGYLAFDADDNLLVPFRTWRNTMTENAAEELSKIFDYPVPERWSISHLYQAILNNEEHVPRIAKITTLAGYVHYRLTGKHVLGIGDASGMFPVNPETKQYEEAMLRKFASLHCHPWKLEEILPLPLIAGVEAGILSEAGSRFLDPSGNFEAGIVMPPPEGDAGTGMVATNSVAKRTGNVSAGTSVFAMIVLEKELSRSYNKFIDLVTTPDGSLVAMSHGNNCTGEYDAWIGLFDEVLNAVGHSVSKAELYDALLGKALEGDSDGGGLLAYNYLSGETMTELYEGRPLFVRKADSAFTLANFMKTQLYTALGVLRIGMDILFKQENVQIDSITGHGGFFKTAVVGQQIMADALHTPISTLSSAGEGGSWGIALLASYLVNKKDDSLAEFLDTKVFSGAEVSTLEPTAEGIKGFNTFLDRYKEGLAIQRAAVAHLP